MTTGLIDKILESEILLKKFILKFCAEFGLENQQLAESVAGFVLNHQHKVDVFGQSLGLDKGIL